jgi:tetratricopeptide (TPR) repeat protein
MRTATLVICGILSSCWFALAGIAAAQPAAPEYAPAEAAAARGDAAAMAEAYDRVLAQYPGDRRARVGRGVARSWLGDRSGARADFEAVLAGSPDDLEALNGLAYDYAWGGDYVLAEQTFVRGLRVEPRHVSLRKGLAFTYLWSGRSQAAEQLFTAIATDYPMDAEATRGIGQARLALGRAQPAEASFEAALALDPEDSAARAGIVAARQLPSPFEATFWVGDSAASNDFELRAFELASWVNPRTRIGLRHDDSLSLDNPALARSGLDADAWFVGAARRLTDQWTGVIEVGLRDLPQGAEQEIYKLEASYAPGPRVWKLGLQSSPHSSGFDDTLLFGGLNFPLADRVRFDATLFLAETGAAGDDETRGVAFVEYRPERNWSLGAGVGIGRISAANAAADGNVSTMHLVARVDLRSALSLSAQIRRENGPLVDYTIGMIGITYRQGRR